MSKIRHILSVIHHTIRYPFPLWWLREYILCLIITINSEVWTFTHYLGLGHETMVCAVCFSVFLTKLQQKHWYRYVSPSLHTRCWKLFIRSTIYHLTNDYLLQWAICCSSGLPFSVFFSGLTPEKLVRSPTCDWSWPNKSVPIKMSFRVVCSRCWGVG